MTRREKESNSKSVGKRKKEKGPRVFIIKDGHFKPSRNKVV